MANTAVIQGRNLCSGWPLEARLPYVDATLTDCTPATPLNPWKFGDFRVQVRAAKVQVDEKGLARAIATLAGNQLANPRVYLKPGNRLGITGTARWKGMPVPVAMDYKLERLDGHTVRLTPCGLMGGAARLAGQVVTLPPPARMGSDGAITLDLRDLQADVTCLETGKGSLMATVGGPPPADRPYASWFEVRCEGDFDAGGGLLHDATAVVSGPKPLPLDDWQRVGSAKLVRGKAAIDPANLKQQIEAQEPLFKVAKITLEGSTYRVEGTYNAFVKLPTRFDLKFTRTPAGQLRVEPGDVRVLGLRAGKVDDLKQLSFLKPDGDGYLVDLKGAAGLDMPKIGPLEARNGCLMLGQP